MFQRPKMVADALGYDFLLSLDCFWVVRPGPYKGVFVVLSTIS